MPPRSPAPDSPAPDAAGSRESPESTPEKKSGLGLSGPQVAGSALASVTAALAASWLGVAGTIIGAALGSLFGTVGSALYAQTIRNSRVAVQRIVPTRPATAGQATATAGEADGQDPTDSDDSSETLTLQESSEYEMVPAQQSGLVDRLRALKWKRIIVGSSVVLVIALGAITAFEQLTGSPVSRYTGGNDSQGTTIGRVFDDSASTSSEDSSQDQSGDQGEPNQPDQFDPTTEPDPTSEPSTPDEGDTEETDPEPEPDSGDTDPTTPTKPDPGAQEPLTPPTTDSSTDDEETADPNLPL